MAFPLQIANHSPKHLLMPTENDFEKQVKVLEQRLRLYETDATFRGYYALNKIANEQIDILNSFKLSDEIGNNPQDDKKYDRVKSIWEGVKGIIRDLNSLKAELKITGNEDKDTKKVPFIERVAETRN